MDVPSLGKIADVMADVRQAFGNIKALQESQKTMMDAIDRLDERLRKLEVDLPVSVSETKREALKEAGEAVQRVQGAMFDRIGDLDKRLDRIERDPTTRLPSPE